MDDLQFDIAGWTIEYDETHLKVLFTGDDGRLLSDGCLHWVWSRGFTEAESRAELTLSSDEREMFPKERLSLTVHNATQNWRRTYTGPFTVVMGLGTKLALWIDGKLSHGTYRHTDAVPEQPDGHLSISGFRVTHAPATAGPRYRTPGHLQLQFYDGTGHEFHDASIRFEWGDTDALQRLKRKLGYDLVGQQVTIDLDSLGPRTLHCTPGLAGQLTAILDAFFARDDLPAGPLAYGTAPGAMPDQSHIPDRSDMPTFEETELADPLGELKTTIAEAVSTIMAQLAHIAGHIEQVDQRLLATNDDLRATMDTLHQLATGVTGLQRQRLEDTVDLAKVTLTATSAPIDDGPPMVSITARRHAEFLNAEGQLNWILAGNDFEHNGHVFRTVDVNRYRSMLAAREILDGLMGSHVVQVGNDPQRLIVETTYQRLLAESEAIRAIRDQLTDLLT